MEIEKIQAGLRASVRIVKKEDGHEFGYIKSGTITSVNLRKNQVRVKLDDRPKRSIVVKPEQIWDTYSSALLGGIVRAAGCLAHPMMLEDKD